MVSYGKGTYMKNIRAETLNTSDSTMRLLVVKKQNQKGFLPELSIILKKDMAEYLCKLINKDQEESGFWD